jgi:hypothetical protein
MRVDWIHNDRQSKSICARHRRFAAVLARVGSESLNLTVVSLVGAMIQIIACAAAPLPTTSMAAGPIRVWDQTRRNPPLHLHFVSVDLRDPAIAVRVVPCGADPDGTGPWQTQLATVELVAQRQHLDVAVNGNFFRTKNTLDVLGKKTPYFPGNWACAVGWAMSDGRLWSAAPAASLVVDASGHVHIGRYDRIPADARQIVSGSGLLVAGGRNIAAGADRAPRTAVGLDRAGQTLILVVIDGRRPDYSVGETLPQLGDEMIRLGGSDALNLDGGGSSTLAVRERSTGQIRIANRPSDGHDLPIPLSLQRPVADVLGITCTTQPGDDVRR